MTNSNSLFLAPLSDPLMVLMMQMVLILAVVRILGFLMRYIKQPQVVGEILAGIILGPTVLGNIPNFTETFFPKGNMVTLQLLSKLALILFMFFVGLEVDASLVFNDLNVALPTAFVTVSAPFAIGVGIGAWVYEYELVSEINSSYSAYICFIGACFSFTAFPVLARILTTFNAITTPIGILTIACAAIDDLISWSLLIVILAFAAGHDPLNGLYVFLIVCGFFIGVYFLIIPFMRRWMIKLHENNDMLNSLFLVAVFFLMLFAAFVMEGLGIDAFIGSFVIGAMIPRIGNIVEDLTEKLELLVVTFLLPLYFALSGVNTNLKTLDTGELWGVTIGVTIAAVLAKGFSAVIPAYFFTKNWNLSFTLGILMNTRGLVGIIALNAGLTTNIISVKIFTIMIVMMIATTMMTSPLFDWYYYQPYLKDLKALEEHVTVAVDSNNPLFKEIKTDVSSSSKATDDASFGDSSKAASVELANVAVPKASPHATETRTVSAQSLHLDLEHIQDRGYFVPSKSQLDEMIVHDELARHQRSHSQHNLKEDLPKP